MLSETLHYCPYIIQSSFPTCVLTDSKPCVQSFAKLCRGQFFSSPRVTTLLSTASRYQISLRHLAGSANHTSDFASRNAPPCDDPRCQICSFVSQAEDSVVRPISVQDVKKNERFCPSSECIVIRWFVIDGLLTALHIKLNHSSQHQLKQIVFRNFYALHLDKALDQCFQTCHTCASLKKIPSCLTQQSTRTTCCCWDIICCRCPKKKQTAHLGRSRHGVFLYYIVHHGRRTP